ncbi:chondroitinase-B domain-containing protein [Aliiglaciecola sp. LCG003]|uniref:chondroitinase-B domain-containing protein n=1 Tax=Aliiglaciecola sp. LCG003 TaxID=3053655 RepID=UPI002573AF7F|nr:chondroitinase-B domain-containing protein [Aliiglaciecola sp. LCG003]WJG08471.1 chondroitinase-B domain-containing protein [Aliiglaciecola sp. LCG003]
MLKWLLLAAILIVIFAYGYLSSSQDGKELTIKAKQYVQINLKKNWGIRASVLRLMDATLELLPPAALIPYQKDEVSVGFTPQSADFELSSLKAQKVHLVSNEKQLYQAAMQAKPGSVILIDEGEYRLTKRLSFRHNGTESKPIKLIGKTPQSVIFKVAVSEGLYLDKAFWQVKNIIFRGDCSSHSICEHAIHIYGDADGSVILNNQFINFNAAIKANGNYNSQPAKFADQVIIKHNDFYNESVRQTTTPASPIDVVGGDNWLVDSNFIADFTRKVDARISVTYGAFFKGGGQHGVMTNNVVNCAWRIPYQSSLDVRVGLSLGNGGTEKAFCQTSGCPYEHNNGKIMDNLIVNCRNDVSIYLNKAAATTIRGNAMFNSLGIDARFEQTSVVIDGNELDGRIRARDGAFVRIKDNRLLN